MVKYPMIYRVSYIKIPRLIGEHMDGLILLMVQKSQTTPPGIKRTWVNNGIIYQPQLVQDNLPPSIKRAMKTKPLVVDRVLLRG